MSRGLLLWPAVNLSRRPQSAFVAHSSPVNQGAALAQVLGLGGAAISLHLAWKGSAKREAWCQTPPLDHCHCGARRQPV